MVRAAAKNHPSVAIVSSPDQYAALGEALAAGGYTFEQRKALAVRAFVHTATYDVAVASWMGTSYVDTTDGTGFPAWLGHAWHRSGALRPRRSTSDPAGSASLRPTSSAARR